MPVVDQNRIKGNFAANYVSHLLSNFCLVRPVAEGTDIGIDLYCETIEEGEPFLHFWVQVKSGSSQIKIKTDGKASCLFKSTHLEYWSRQPVPVFAFYVPLDYPPECPNQIYIADLSKQLLFPQSFASGEKSIESDFVINPKEVNWREKAGWGAKVIDRHSAGA